MFRGKVASIHKKKKKKREREKKKILGAVLWGSKVKWQIYSACEEDMNLEGSEG